MTDFGALADFHALVRFDGFGEASRGTGRPKSSLVRRIGRLEQSIGVRLLERTRTGFKLTDAGRELHLETRGLIRELGAICAAVSRGADSLSGTLRVSAPVLFAETIMGRLVADFLRIHPLLTVELVAEDRRVDLAEERFDVVVRVHPDRGSELVGRCFYKNQRLLVASEEVAHPTFRNPTFPAVVALSQMQLHWTVQDRGLPLVAQPNVRLTTSSLVTLREAALAGLGAAQLPTFLVERDLLAGRLVSWGPAAHSEVELWALHTSRRHTSAKVTAFMDFLCLNAPPRMAEASGIVD